MQEIVLFLSSLAGVATAAAVRRVPKKVQLLEASPQIKNQLSSLTIEKEILTKAISRLYQSDTGLSKIQKDRLLVKYQHQLGIILAKSEKLEYASKHPDLGPIGDGLITLMDQRLSKLDDRLHELSSKITLKDSRPAKLPDIEKKIAEKQTEKQTVKQVKDTKRIELTTLTHIPAAQTLLSPHIVQDTPAQAAPTHAPAQVTPAQATPAQITPAQPAKVVPVTPQVRPAASEPLSDVESEDDFVDDDDDLNEIKKDIAKVLSKLGQAEVE